MRYSIYRIDPRRAIAGDHPPEFIGAGDYPMTVSEFRDSWILIQNYIKDESITEPGTYLVIWQQGGIFLRVYEVREPRIPLEVIH